MVEPLDGLSVIVPVFRSNESLPILLNRVHAVVAQIDHEIVLVDDGTLHSTWLTIQKLASAEIWIVGVRLGRGAGQHDALSAGLREARYPVSVIIDDDFQNPPEEITRLVETLVGGG